MADDVEHRLAQRRRQGCRILHEGGETLIGFGHHVALPEPPQGRNQIGPQQRIQEALTRLGIPAQPRKFGFHEPDGVGIEGRLFRRAFQRAIQTAQMGQRVFPHRAVGLVLDRRQKVEIIGQRRPPGDEQRELIAQQIGAVGRIEFWAIRPPAP